MSKLGKASPWEKAARTRKKNARARERAARERSARARHAALVRWYGEKGKTSKKQKASPSPKKLPPRRPPTKKPIPKKVVGKKKKPGPKPKKDASVRAALARANRKIRQQAKIMAQQRVREQITAANLEKGIMKERGKGKIRLLDTWERRGAEENLPPRMRHEKDENYARRIIRQLMGRKIYTVEAGNLAIEYYKAISDASGVHEQRVFTLFMSPQVA